MLTSDKVLTPAAEALSAQAPVKHSPTAHVLIVDDEPAACKLLALLLSQAGFECKSALSGAEALLLPRLQGNRSAQEAVTLYIFDWITLAPGVIRL